MDRQTVDAFLGAHKQLVLATIRRDGRAQLSNVLGVYRAGELLVSTRESSAKYRNVQRDPRVTAVIQGDNFFQYLVVDGRARFTRMPEALPLLREYYEMASGGPHPNWDEYDEAMAQEQRVVLHISIDGTHGFNV